MRFFLSFGMLKFTVKQSEQIVTNQTCSIDLDVATYVCVIKIQAAAA